MLATKLVDALEAAKRYFASSADYQRDIALNIIDCVLEELQAPKKVEAQEKISVVRAGRQNRLRMFEGALRLPKKEIFSIMREVIDHLRQGNFYGRDLNEEERRAVLKYLGKLEKELEKQETGSEQ